MRFLDGVLGYLSGSHERLQRVRYVEIPRADTLPSWSVSITFDASRLLYCWRIWDVEVGDFERGAGRAYFHGEAESFVAANVEVLDCLALNGLLMTEIGVS